MALTLHDSPLDSPPIDSAIAAARAGRDDGSVPDEAARAAKRAYVRTMFGAIAPRYDLLNRVLSMGIDRRWRRAALEALAWRGAPGGTFLDLCAGTMDVSVQLASASGFTGRVMAADFAEPMLRAGRGKARARRVHPVTSDALALPLAGGVLDGAIVAFGIRNVADLDAGLAEVRRVLRPGARFVILEFSTPRQPLVRAAYHAYFHHVLPRIGAWVSGHRSAYAYLPASVAHFPTEQVLADRLRAAGFPRVEWRALTFGIAALHVATA
ncbi:MAG: ubiquinone/menaquinone biosynthesis methyltransferase [Gemmatimonadaceae bacterium]|jgi:demethylmenaquinone methyltransferase/2-methoxy-6-polyprenyl-1,4-benzoquinol methylase|nr:ubiquinone/menaquinone biosynthesis methyltransferase [Gemmatimonadaceae bacterium]